MRHGHHFGFVCFYGFDVGECFLGCVTECGNFEYYAFGFRPEKPCCTAAHVFVLGDNDFIAAFEGDGSTSQVYAFAYVFGDGDFTAFTTDDGGELIFETAIVHGICGIFCQIVKAFVECLQNGVWGDSHCAIVEEGDFGV